MAIAQVRNYADVNDSFYSEEMEYLNRWDARIQNAYDQLFEQIEASRFGSMSDRIFGESGVEDLQMSAQASSQEILSLQEQEKELEAQYYYTYAQATVETPEGEVLYADLEPEGQQAYYESFIQRYSAQMGELFMQLVQLRRQMAQALGYESYTEVADQFPRTAQADAGAGLSLLFGGLLSPRRKPHTAGVCLSARAAGTDPAGKLAADAGGL